jgi:8-amino-7-oxononanoate synthase
MQSAQGARVRLRGHTLINFSSNDYLNLAADPRLAAAAARTARRYGCGAGSSPLVSGHLPPLRALERALADWEGTEAALVFSSGFVANLATISSLVGPDDVLFSDELNHASLIDGCRLARAQVRVYRHGDLDHLRELLAGWHGCDSRGTRRRLIVTDTVFSMDGDLAPLAELGDLAQRHDCLLLIDEAHATGVLGERGRGLSEVLPPRCDPERVVKVGTLSKALGTQGGFVCGSRRLVSWLVNHARPYVFSTALAPPSAAAARRAVGLIVEEPQPRRHLLDLAVRLREQLRDAGFQESNSRCQMVPVVIGESRTAMAVSGRLEERGLLVPAIRPPSVPPGTARLRISLTAGHTEEDVRRLVEALRDCRAVVARA